jgi:hypothetical protein
MTETDLRAEFAQVVRGRGSLDRLLTGVRGFVRDLKRQGVAPEQVIITIKQVCGMPLVPVADHADFAPRPDLARSISEVVINASIKEYFSGPVLERMAKPFR